MSRPEWYKQDDPGTWERVKKALKADWEQTKADLGSEEAKDLNQGIADTFKQMAGKQPLPNFEDKEEAFRYGTSAREHYKSDWNNAIENEIRSGYHGDYKTDRPYIYYGYSRHQG